MLPNCFLVIHITILCRTAIIMVTEIGIRSPTDTVCLYLLMKCSSWQLPFLVMFLNIRGLVILNILIFPVAVCWSICPGLLLSRAQNDVDKCSKYVNLSCNDKHFSPLISIGTQVRFRVLRSIRLRRRERVGPLGTQEFVAIDREL